MIKNLSITLLCCIKMQSYCLFDPIMTMNIIAQQSALQQAQDKYHSSPQYKKWQLFKLHNESILKQLDEKFFDAHNKCVKQNAALVPRFFESEECIQARQLSRE